ncbi:hypothetical protein MDMS009_2939 [Methylophaga thiooxydans DMS010]|uniref:Uncharacterized protein n=1 Tax=Methylophaga thiooxydans DMS010 TaxID=637616 RepID=C0NA04_9GAMM|nr:hypothetical protein MDMS009_2939 [Methylophaga thiooxydans DMS010]
MAWGGGVKFLEGLILLALCIFNEFAQGAMPVIVWSLGSLRFFRLFALILL